MSQITGISKEQVRVNPGGPLNKYVRQTTTITPIHLKARAKCMGRSEKS